MKMTETLNGHLSAEWIRLKGSVGAWFSLVGLLFGILSILLSGGARAAGFESAVFSWQVMYFTGMAAPLMMVLAGIQEARDRSSRSAGLGWRGAHARYAQFARLLGAAVVALVFQALSYGSIIVIAGAPTGRGLTAMFYSFLGSLGYLALGALVSRWAGLAGALIAGIIWQIVGGIFTESDWWWLVPPAWPIRIMLEPTGVNFNGTPIDPTNPVLADPPLLGPALCLVFAVAVGALTCLTATWAETRIPRGARRGPGSSPVSSPVAAAPPSSFGRITHARRPRAHRALPLDAVLLILRGSGIWVLAGLAVLIIAVAASTYEPTLVAQIVTFFLFPIGVGLLPVLTWRSYRPGHVQLHVHNRSATAAFLLVHVLIIAVLTAVLAVCLSIGGMPVDEVLARAALWLLVGIALCGASLALTARFGPSLALIAMIFWTILGLTLGGDVLSETYLWVVALPAWPHLGLPGHRLPIALGAAALLAIAGLVAARGALASARRRA